MCRRVWFLGVIFSFALTLPASAQVSATGTSRTTTGTVPTSIPTFFSNPFAKPDFSAMSAKPNVPAPLNLPSMMPSFSNLGNSVMLKNFFSPQMSVTAQRQQTAATQAAQAKNRKRTPFGGTGTFLP